MDNQVFFNQFGNISEIIADTLMICEGMDMAQAEMSNEKAFNTLAAGVFGILAYTINATHDKMSAMESEYHEATGVKYPYQMTDEENRAWALERGRWL